MRELVGKLNALDPDASESLKIVAYFDKLVDGRVGADGLLRGATILSGVPIGWRLAGSPVGQRFGAGGVEIEPGSSDRWPSVSSADGSTVWLERSGAAHANDSMILERLAIALSILSLRLDTSAPTRQAVEVLLAGDTTEAQREEAAARLALGAHTPVHAVAVPVSIRIDRPLPHAVVATRFGIVRAVLTADDTAPAAWAGIGVLAEGIEQVRDSWRSALVALRLADSQDPVVRAVDLGVLLHLAEGEDHRAVTHPDVGAIQRLAGGYWNERLLHSLADGASQRVLATEAGVHHSTMGARLRSLSTTLGYDPTTSRGRTRLQISLLLHRLDRTRFDSEL